MSFPRRQVDGIEDRHVPIQTVLKRPLFELWQGQGSPTESRVIALRSGAVHVSRRELAVDVVIIVQGDPQLLEVVLTADSSGRGASLLNRR